jgi:hypothetical protein
VLLRNINFSPRPESFQSHQMKKLHAQTADSTCKLFAFVEFNPELASCVPQPSSFLFQCLLFWPHFGVCWGAQKTAHFLHSSFKFSLFSVSLSLSFAVSVSVCVHAEPFCFLLALRCSSGAGTAVDATPE